MKNKVKQKIAKPLEICIFSKDFSNFVSGFKKKTPKTATRIITQN